MLLRPLGYRRNPGVWGCAGFPERDLRKRRLESERSGLCGGSQGPQAT